MATTTLLASTTATASGTSSATDDLPDDICGAAFLLDITADEQTALDTLDVYIQSSINGGTDWDDFVHFTQHAGNAGAAQEIAAWTPGATIEDEIRTPQDGALAAASVINNPQGHTWRVKYVINDDSGNASFTFSVKANLYRRAHR